ncbi:uncharacterized protein LOC124121779 [Haliotis rufescens]|uniref:uncharacterized protein LOC124121779 n=1 Tax=Haliotis rufescens TaxID=6454 RepID=UPI00201EB9AF|nr:uncharacterized protein LOC124121779 [Haliotis rufescens]
MSGEKRAGGVQTQPKSKRPKKTDPRGYTKGSDTDSEKHQLKLPCSDPFPPTTFCLGDSFDDAQTYFSQEQAMLPVNFVSDLKKKHPHVVKRVADLLEYNRRGIALFGRSLATTLNLPCHKPPDVLQCDVLIITRKCLPFVISFSSEAVDDAIDKYNAELAHRMRVTFGKYTAERFTFIFLATEEKIYGKKTKFHSTVHKRRSTVIESCFPDQKHMTDSKFEGLKKALTATAARTSIPMAPKEGGKGSFWVLMKEQFSKLLNNVDLRQPSDVSETLLGKTVFMFEAALRLERSGKTLLIYDSVEEKTKQNHVPAEGTIETIDSFRQSGLDWSQFKYIIVAATRHQFKDIQDTLKALRTPIWRIYERDEVKPPTETLSIGLIGYPKTGKSLLANAIAGEKLFDAGLQKPTAVCQEKRVRIGNRAIQILDTPGFSLYNKQNIQTTVDVVVTKESSIDAFLLVAKASTMTYAEELLFKYVRSIAGKSMSHKIVLVLTTLDENLTLKEYLENIPNFLKDFLHFCHNPPVLVNVNTGTESEKANDQRQELFRTIGGIHGEPVQENKQCVNTIRQKVNEAICEQDKCRKHDSIQYMQRIHSFFSSHYGCYTTCCMNEITSNQR